MRTVIHWLAAALLLLLGGAAAQASMGPTELVRDTADRILDTFKQNREAYQAEPQKLYDLVDAVVLPHFDFDRMSRLVLGKYWRQADADQRGRFAREFQTMLVRTYSKALWEYTDQKIAYLPMRGSETDGDVLVRTEVQQPGGYPIPINYSLYRADNGWKVYDVVIDNISLVTNYRASFANEIRKSGIDGLIANLQQRNHGK